MFSFAQLQTVRDGLKYDVSKAQELLAALDRKIQSIKADGTRHPAWIKEKIDEARAAALPAISEIVCGFDERLQPVLAQKPFWLSKPLLLSLQQFDKEPATDAAIRAAKLAEFERMSAPVLQIVSDNAIADKNHPTLWLAYLAGLERHGQPGWTGISLDDVAVPNQAEALQLIDQCRALTHTAHACFAQASGAVLTGLDRLTAARNQAAA